MREVEQLFGEQAWQRANDRAYDRARGRSRATWTSGCDLAKLEARQRRLHDQIIHIEHNAERRKANGVPAYFDTSAPEPPSNWLSDLAPSEANE